MGGGDPMLRRHAESDFRFAAKLWQLGCACFVVSIVLFTTDNEVLGLINFALMLIFWYTAGKHESLARLKQRKAEK